MIGFKNYAIGGFSMLLNTITAKHPNSFVLLIPKSRDDKNYVRDWEVLSTSKKYNGILKVAEYYRSEGMSNAVILSTSDNLVVKPNEVAKFFRVYYGLLTIAGVVIHLEVASRWHLLIHAGISILIWQKAMERARI